MKKVFLLMFAVMLTLTTKSQVAIKFYDKSNVRPDSIYSGNNILKEFQYSKKDISPSLNPKANSSLNESYGSISTDINLDFKNGVEKMGDLLIQRIKLTVEGVSNIKISFNKFKLSDNAEMYIYNQDKTIITGPITKNENINGNRVWSSNSFPDSSIIIEIKSPISETNNNQILISKVFISTLLNKTPIIKPQSDSLLFGLFNTSSSCNINVLCSQGIIM